MKVYFKLNDDETGDVELQPGFETVMFLKSFICTKNPYLFSSGGPSNIHVFAVGSDPDRDEPLHDMMPVPNDSAKENPLIVVRVEGAAMAKRRRVTISNVRLLAPVEVSPPRDTTPKFICPPDWLQEVKTKILARLEEEDEDNGPIDKDGKSDCKLRRVPPMSLVRCSRGGKTRALYEIANAMKGYSDYLEDHVACLYVSFNDYTSLQPWEQADPLQALFRRIAFAASTPPPESRGTRAERFDAFLKDKPVWKKDAFLQWIGDTPCVLLIDELNNLNELTQLESDAAADFGRFLKTNFIGIKNRYLVYSSHLLGTNVFLSQYMDPSKGSHRHVELQELPLVPSLQQALTLKPSLDSAREAVYYGLIPGMIYESCGTGIAGKRKTSVEDAIEKSKDLEIMFRSILRSLIDGVLRNGIPEDLHILLDSAKGKEYDDDKIRWVPYHLQFVLEALGRNVFGNQELAGKLAHCCYVLKDAKEKSGDGWESLFVLLLVARCLNKLTDNTFVPPEWFLYSQNTTDVCLNAYDSSLNNGVPFGDCKTWDSMKDGVPIGVAPQIAVLFPSHNNFEVYDVIVAFSQHGKRSCVFGYQLKEGKKSSRNHSPHRDMAKSFWVQGSPPTTTETTELGWTIPSRESINSFFGESGKHWTPECWRKFETLDS